jgi:2-polyprenyl-3-methyl-5-hydroxy-6-metoxy-1,4-benzoquinol methylase
MSEEGEAMTDLFREKAEDWDARETIRLLSAGVGASILKHVELHERMQVMDFGAGTGLIAAQVAPFVARIVAVDVSQSMLERLVAKPELQGKVEALCRDILGSPLDERFDLIMSAMAMHHVEDTGKLIRRFAEHLAPGGRVALADLDTEDGSFHPPETQGVYHAGFDRSALHDLFTSHGFGDIRFVTAHTVVKEQGSYPVFLLTATKQAD